MGGERPQYADQEVADLVEYQLEFALVWSFDEFLRSELLQKALQNDTAEGARDAVQRLLTVWWMHCIPALLASDRIAAARRHKRRLRQVRLG